MKSDFRSVLCLHSSNYGSQIRLLCVYMSTVAANPPVLLAWAKQVSDTGLPSAEMCC